MMKQRSLLITSKKAVLYLLAVCLLSATYLNAAGEAYMKTKIKNRATLQKNTGAFKNTKYKYVSETDIKKNQYKKNKNLGVVNIKKADNIREANVYVESNSKIRVNNKRNKSLQIGVVNVGKNANVKKVNVFVKAKKGIDIKQSPQNNKTQIGVVNVKKSSKVRDIRTIVESNKKIQIK